MDDAPIYLARTAQTLIGLMAAIGLLFLVVNHAMPRYAYPPTAIIAIGIVLGVLCASLQCWPRFLRLMHQIGLFKSLIPLFQLVIALFVLMALVFAPLALIFVPLLFLVQQMFLALLVLLLIPVSMAVAPIFWLFDLLLLIARSLGLRAKLEQSIIACQDNRQVVSKIWYENPSF